MSGKRYTDEFKIEAVRQVTERGHRVVEVAQRLGITTHCIADSGECGRKCAARSPVHT
jgi:transposase